MKILILNKTQQKRLLSLCKEFFPAYKDIYFSELGDKLQTLVFTTHKEQYGYKARTFIHWYQLCLTELPERICKKIDYNSIFNKDFYDFSNTSEEGWYSKLATKLIEYRHPVDFLWEYVQDCKKHKYFIR